MGVLYILDEPSIGLHQRDNQRLLNTLTYLRDLGNTVIVVEHDEEAIRSADYVVDIGPGAGVHGGHVMAQGTCAEVMATPGSLTGQYLGGARAIAVPTRRTPWLPVNKAAAAAKVVFAPTVPLRITGGEEYLRRYLDGRVLTRGDVIEISVMGRKIELVATKISPSVEAVIMGDRTAIEISEKPAKEERATPRITYEDIGGLGPEIKKIREMIELPMKHPELFERLGVEAPKGVLLHGPPGTGKTLLAKALASETNSHFQTLSGPEIMSKYYGETEERLRDIFKEAEEQPPSIIFIDEIDSIAPKRE
jgi:ABC-type glutathione transport system ATPase component